MLVQEIGDTIKKRRKQLRITQPNLAELAEVSPNTIYKLERGQANPTIEIIGKIADVLGMELTIQIKGRK
ncbi:MAG: helix-turn-helix transcriptional regulator [Bacteroidia bacterium]|nr:helix-turn-helix transcriptional regulator [Bacteroidia bacterium]